ncbi:unnamed protein product [Allacma fusca]|uniref:Replication termination factor 2 n=1 Tax=Allacma fusca TaxID=39272 RepID=A0A8J2KB43_9HEXA|nr:unnamed protein product [Allacma fusca]
MGCDGGTIPKRDELVRTKKKPEQKDRTSERAFRWKHCAVSQAPLQQPVVGCELGRIYNKDAVIEALLDKSKATEVVAHLRTLRDVKELKLTENPTWTENEVVDQQGDGYVDTQTAKWICPIVGQEMNGKFRFVFIWSCGCVLSERAIKEVGSSKKAMESDSFECLKCQKPFSAADVIQLNPIEEDEISQTRQKMEARREKVKNAKKAKKQKNGLVSETVTSDKQADGDEIVTLPGSTKMELNISKRKEGSGVEEAAGPSGNKRSKVNSTTEQPTTLEKKPPKLTGKYSVSKDPEASETYKSLFTTHSTAKTQDKAHWVTYNPFYN